MSRSWKLSTVTVDVFSVFVCAKARPAIGAPKGVARRSAASADVQKAILFKVASTEIGELPVELPTKASFLIVA